MPVVVRLRLCVILMFFRDHNPPHFHVRTTEGEAQMKIDDLTLMEGRVDRRAAAEARAWARGNRVLLERRWRELSGGPEA